MLHDTAAGVMYLHKRHYVHGDLRSPNLFVGLDGRVSCGAFVDAMAAGTDVSHVFACLSSGSSRIAAWPTADNTSPHMALFLHAAKLASQRPIDPLECKTYGNVA